MAGAFEPEVAQVTSNDLEAQVRNLLPSVAGFGSRLGAQNVIVPIVDLTPTAEGSTLPNDLQTSIAFGSVTAFSAIGSSATIENNPGFYRVFGAYSSSTNSATVTADINMTDGATTKTIIGFRREAPGGQTVQLFDFVVFLRAGDSITAVTSDTVAQIEGCSRQIADVNGILVNPVGFTPL